MILCVFPGIEEHGDLDQRIADITRQLQLNPGDLSLYRQRGDLYLQHEEYDKAIADFHYCDLKGLNDPHIYSGLSVSYLKAHQADSALFFIEKVLSIEPSNPAYLDIKVSVLEDLGENCSAALLLEKIIALSPHPSPALFLRASACWKYCDETNHVDRSIAILKKGLDQLSHNFVIHSQLIRVYENYKRYEEALYWQTELIARSPSRPRPYLDRAKIYLALNDKVKAKADLETVLSSIEKLAVHKQDTRAMKDLRIEIEQLLSQQ
ncbi:MAG: hypothetical protein ABIQ11_00245 [Saprospiraceae bacterium]